MAAIRMNITVPESVKARMKNFPETNWSAVATEAFREKLEQLEKTQINTEPPIKKE